MEEATQGSARATAAGDVSVEPARAARGDGEVDAGRTLRLEAEVARLAFLDALSVHVAESAGEPELLDGVARLAATAFGAWVGLFVMAEEGGIGLAVQAGSASLGAALAPRLLEDPRDRLARTCAGGEPAVVDDLPPGPGGAQPAVVLAALAVKGRSLGALAVASEGAGSIPAEPSLVAEVARRTALAVEHARLLRDATLAARAREEFLHVASHELRGPVGTLGLTLQLLARDVKKGSCDAVAARLGAVDRQTQRLVRLSDTLLDVSRITAGRLDLAREPGDLAALVREVVARSAGQAADAGVEVRVEAPAPVPCLFDPARLDQVVTNLLSNALKYGLGRPVRVAVAAVDGRARLEVEDRGIGIPPEDQERVFGRFERAVSSRHYGGLGLGLWIVRRLVEGHGGTITMRSVPGEGSTFIVEIP